MGLTEDGPTDAHRHVLELLSTKIEVAGRERIQLSPACITKNIGYKTSNYIGEICRELEEFDLVKKVEEKGAYYAITYRGRAYLKGDLDVDFDD